MLVIPHTHTNITTDLQHSNLPHASTAEPATMHPHEMQVVQASRLSRCEHSLGRHLHTAPELSLGLSGVNIASSVPFSGFSELG